jgi:cell division protein FtsZ
MEEVQQIHDFMNKVGENVQVIWGATFDDSLGDNVKITIIATGYGVSDIPGMPANAVKNTKKSQTHESGNVLQNVIDAFQNLTADKTEKEVEDVQSPIEKAYDEYYGKNEKSEEPEIQQSIDDLEIISKEKFFEEPTLFEAPPVKEVEEPQIKTISLDDLEDDKTLKKVESIPAWKRKFMKNK